MLLCVIVAAALCTHLNDSTRRAGEATQQTQCSTHTRTLAKVQLPADFIKVIVAVLNVLVPGRQVRAYEAHGRSIDAEAHGTPTCHVTTQPARTITLANTMPRGSTTLAHDVETIQKR